MKVTYQLKPPPIDAMEWDSYAIAVEDELQQLLRSEECAEEKYQHFLELNPSLLPWGYGTFGGGHHGLIHGAVISQPRLPGLGGYKPDFLYIATDSAAIYAVLIEIESPCKPWFTQSGQPSSKLTQAMNQLREWKIWFEKPENETAFRRHYRVPSGAPFDERRFLQKYYLIYGRRDDLTKSGRSGQRSMHEGPDEHFVSWDHLRPSLEYRDTITATLDRSGYRAISVPPTLRLGPHTARQHDSLAKKADVATTHPMMQAQRAKFLQSRWPYWDSWASLGNHGLIKSRDWE